MLPGALTAYLLAAGLGLDFNTDLVEQISGVRGSNYFSVHSPGEFRRRCGMLPVRAGLHLILPALHQRVFSPSAAGWWTSLTTQ